MPCGIMEIASKKSAKLRLHVICQPLVSSDTRPCWAKSRFHAARMLRTSGTSCTVTEIWSVCGWAYCTYRRAVLPLAGVDCLLATQASMSKQ